MENTVLYSKILLLVDELRSKGLTGAVLSGDKFEELLPDVTKDDNNGILNWVSIDQSGNEQIFTFKRAEHA